VPEGRGEGEFPGAGMRGRGSAEELAEGVGTFAEVGQVAVDHLGGGDAGGVDADVDGGDDAILAGADRDGDGAEAKLELFVGEGEGVGADAADDFGEDADVGDGFRSQGLQLDAIEKCFELGVGQRGEKDSSHRSAVSRQAASHRQSDGHDALGGGAREINDLVAVEDAQRTGFVEEFAEVLEEGLGDGRQRRGGEVGKAELENASLEAEGTPRVFSVAKLREGDEDAADGGARKAGDARELRNGEPLGVAFETFENFQPASKRENEIGVADEGSEVAGGIAGVVARRGDG